MKKTAFLLLLLSQLYCITTSFPQTNWTNTGKPYSIYNGKRSDNPIVVVGTHCVWDVIFSPSIVVATQNALADTQNGDTLDLITTDLRHTSILGLISYSCLAVEGFAKNSKNEPVKIRENAFD